MIQRNIQSFRESGIIIDPLTDIKDQLDLFYGDEQVNNQMTMVCGTDLCEMLGLFHYLAEKVNELNVKKISELEKYKIAYNNRVRRDKRKEEEEKQVAKNQNIEDDEKFSIISKQNTDLMMQNARYEEQLKELTENLDLLIVENDEKDNLIQSLELDLKEKSHHTEHLKMGAIMASQEADQLQRIANEREAKLMEIKLEKEMKENEAAAHLKMVEEKAKRVD